MTPRVTLKARLFLWTLKDPVVAATYRELVQREAVAQFQAYKREQSVALALTEHRRLAALRAQNQ